MPLEIGEKKSSRGNGTQSSFFLRVKKGAGGGGLPQQQHSSSSKKETIELFNKPFESDTWAKERGKRDDENKGGGAQTRGGGGLTRG